MKFIPETESEKKFMEVIVKASIAAKNFYDSIHVHPSNKKCIKETPERVLTRLYLDDDRFKLADMPCHYTKELIIEAMKQYASILVNKRLSEKDPLRNEMNHQLNHLMAAKEHLILAGRRSFKQPEEIKLEAQINLLESLLGLQLTKF